jgi:hypothetical protein
MRLDYWILSATPTVDLCLSFVDVIDRNLHAAAFLLQLRYAMKFGGGSNEPDEGWEGRR